MTPEQQNLDRLGSYYCRLVQYQVQYPNRWLQLCLWRQYRALKLKQKQEQ